MKRHAFPAAGLAGLGAIVWLGAVQGAVPGPVSSPTSACRLLADQRLPAHDGYREQRDGAYGCRSAPQRLAAGRPLPHEIRYQVVGDRGRVAQLQLELTLRSPGEVQTAYRELARLADLLTIRSLGRALPEEAVRAIGAGTPGTWLVARAEIALERIVGAAPALRFVIRFVDTAR